MGGSMHLLVRDRRAKQEAWEVACIFSYDVICALTDDEHDYFGAARLRDHDAPRGPALGAADPRVCCTEEAAGVRGWGGDVAVTGDGVAEEHARGSRCSCSQAQWQAQSSLRSGRESINSPVSTSLNVQRLVGKVALITGTASGIGKATAAEFIMNGARVVLVNI